MFFQIQVQIKTLRELNKRYNVYFIIITEQMLELWPGPLSLTLTYDEQILRLTLHPLVQVDVGARCNEILFR